MDELLEKIEKRSCKGEMQFNVMVIYRCPFLDPIVNYRIQRIVEAWWEYTGLSVNLQKYEIFTRLYK